MSPQLSFGLVAFTALFGIVDPVGVSPLFLALTAKDGPVRRRELARRACFVAGGVMVLFAVAGERLLSVMGISLDAFRIAGGLLMLVTAFDQLRASPPRTRSTDEEQTEGTHKEDISVVPLAMPLLAGPGAIATSMVLMSRAQGPIQSSLVVAAIVLTMTVAYVAMRSAELLSRALGTTGRLVAERLIGLLLAAIGTQFIVDGARGAWRG
jgi:multiple antibiotic resistance protein